MLTSITNNISILILIGGGVQVVQQKMNREVARTISNGAFDSKEQVHHVAIIWNYQDYHKTIFAII